MFRLYTQERTSARAHYTHIYTYAHRRIMCVHVFIFSLFVCVLLFSFPLSFFIWLCCCSLPRSLNCWHLVKQTRECGWESTLFMHLTEANTLLLDVKCIQFSFGKLGSPKRRVYLYRALNNSLWFLFCSQTQSSHSPNCTIHPLVAINSLSIR